MSALDRRTLLTLAAAAAAAPAWAAKPCALDLVLYDPHAGASGAFARARVAQGAEAIERPADLAQLWTDGIVARFAAAPAARISGLSRHADLVVLQSLLRPAGGRLVHDARHESGPLYAWSIEKRA